MVNLLVDDLVEGGLATSREEIEEFIDVGDMGTSNSKDRGIKEHGYTCFVSRCGPNNNDNQPNFDLYPMDVVIGNSDHQYHVESQVYAHMI